MVKDHAKGKELDSASGGPAGTFEDPHKHTFSIKELSASTVVLYPDQAEITRDIENIQLKPGVNEVTIKNLTGYCQEHSVKVEGKGNATITDMTVEQYFQNGAMYANVGWGNKRANFAAAASDSESESESESSAEEDSDNDADSDDDPDFAVVKAIDQEIKEIKLLAADAQEELRGAETQLFALERYGMTITSEFAEPGLMIQYLEAYQETRKKLFAQHKEAKTTIERLEKELKKKERERLNKGRKPVKAKMKKIREKEKVIAKKNAKKREKKEKKDASKRLRPANMYTVKVMVETNVETEASLTLKYLVHNASWQPRYDLRLDSISKSGQIVYRAHFSNKTYESWKDAKITFSSSAQTFGGLNEVVPLMAAWNISLGKNRVFGTATDHSDGLYSLKEQSELEKRGVNIAGKKNALQQQQNQMQLQQRQQHLMMSQQANYGNKPPVPSLFGGAQGNQGLFGNPAPQQQSNVAVGGLFGAQQAPAPQGGGLFGAPQAPQANVNRGGFGGGPATGGLFGNASNAIVPQPTGFGGAQQQQQQQMAPVGFGSAVGTSSFGTRVEEATPLPHVAAAPIAPPAGEPEKSEEVEIDGDGASTLAPGRTAMLIAESSASESYGMTTTYEIAGLKTIKSSPLTRRQVISTIELPNVTFNSIAVVKLRPAAFLKAKFKNTSKHTFLKGTGGLTVDGSFLGQTTIPHCPPDDTISLSLGVDTGVHVSYAKPTLVSSSQGFITKENVTLYKRSIFIHNAKSQALTLTVLDQIPVSEDERLKVNIVNPKGLREGGDAVKTGAPGASNLDNKWGTASAVLKSASSGEITYTVKLEKGRSCKLPLEYEVKLPSGEKVIALS